MGVHTDDIDQFLTTVGKLERKIHQLIHKSNLSDTEKKIILDHILIVPAVEEKITD